ncbi:hypothetical protein WR25_14758 isoform C [Diploscapter pachys]|uniref:Transthyretin/hydroxyisourate hydrolase domain-containing protein n=1 Tax=Diploscapter pachys TaxID=2018661 RepID=A0A2A2LBU5_9BILA|nr:hypothetical protein WR25_14758 isoform C [Diploscapter pachys]
MREAWSSLLTWALLLSAVRIVASYEQAVVVKGIINCRGQRMPGMFVQLMEEDSLFDADDLMGSTNADFRGVFCVRGFADEISKIEPFILIEHNCGYEGLNEKARSVYHHYVPSEFIVAGNRSHKIYHLGDIELLAPEAPIREHNRIGMLKPTGVQELDVRMKECIPVYIQYQKTMRLGAKAADASQEVAHVLPQDPAESTTELSDLQPKPTSSPLFSQSAILSASPIQTETRTEQQEVGENKHKYEKEQLEIREKEERQKLEEEEENRRRQEVMDLRRKKEEEERERQLEQETAQKVEAVRIQELKRLEQEAQRKVEEEKRRIEYQKRVEEYWRREKERQLQEAARRKEERKRAEAEERAKLDAEWAHQSQKNDLTQLPDESESVEVEVCRLPFLSKLYSTFSSVFYC